MRTIWRSWFTPLAFIALLAILSPSVGQFEFDPDEGIELMKGRLLAEGHPLYSEVWNDQPPLLSAIFAGAFRLFGEQVGTGRFVVLLFSGLLIWSWQRVALRLSGPAAAAVTVGILVTLPAFLRLSISAMAGLPAVALASAALAFHLDWHRTGSRLVLLASGALLALAVVTKLFMALLVPILLAGIVLAGIRERRLPVGALATWLVAFGVVSGLAAVLWLTPEAREQLTAPHAAARSAEAFGRQAWSRGFDASGALLALAAAGAVLQLRRGRWLWSYPAAWAAVGLVLLLFHRPVWYHQRLLVTVPAAILAAVPIVEAFRTFRPGASPRRLVMSVLVIGVAGLMAGQHLNPLRSFLAGGDADTPQRDRSERIVREMETRTDRDAWVVTDRPMHAFRAGRSAPPPVAVLTAKRLRTGFIDEPALRAAIDTFGAELVFLDRFSWDDLTVYLEKDFDRITDDDLLILYVRKGIKP